MNIRQFVIKLIFLIIILVLPMSGLYSEEIIRVANYNNMIMYNDIDMNNEIKFEISGINLLKYGFDKIYKYLITNENELFILGTLKSNRRISLFYIKSKDADLLKVAEYPFSGQYLISVESIKIFVLKLLNTKTLLTFLIYRQDLSGAKVDHTLTNIEIYMQEKNDEFKLHQKEEIEEINIVPSQDDGFNEYYAHADIVDLENQNKVFPAFKRSNKIIVCDVNNDGYEDILIWSKINLSRLMKDEDKEDFIFDSEKLYVMYFDPAAMAFRNRVPFECE